MRTLKTKYEFARTFLADPTKMIEDPKYLNFTDEHHVNIVMLVASLGMSEFIPKLVECGYDLNVEGNIIEKIDDSYLIGRFYGTAIHVAVYAGNFDTAKTLQRYGADVNKHSGLAYFLSETTSGILRLILFAGGDDKMNVLFNELKADVNQCDEYNRTPLLETTISGRVNQCEMLLKLGADVNTQERGSGHYNGRTPFIAAVMFQRVEIACLFVKSGNVDYSLRLENGNGPLDFATDQIRSLINNDMIARGFLL